MRQALALKEAQLSQIYSTFVDSEPAFVFNPTELSIPESLVETKMKNVLYKEKKALLFQNKCTRLEKKYRELENEKEAVRYFWRNTLVEGQNRAARMLKKCLVTNK